jgi:hypothetical protein
MTYNTVHHLYIVRSTTVPREPCATGSMNVWPVASTITNLLRVELLYYHTTSELDYCLEL